MLDELFKNTEGEAFTRCTVVPFGGGYFEGVKALGDYSSERIVLCFPRCSVEIEGTELTIRKYCDGDLHILGQIVAVKMIREG